MINTIIRPPPLLPLPSSQLPHATLPLTGITSPRSACLRVCLGACLLLSLPETPRAVCYHSVPLAAFMVSVHAFVCTAGLCSPYRQHQPNPTAVLPDSEPMCNEGPTLRCENKLQLSMNTASLPPPFCQSTGYTQKPWPKVKLFYRSQCRCFTMLSVRASVCVFSKKSFLMAAWIFVKAPPDHYPFNVLPTADSSIYGTGLYLPIKPFIV